MIWRAFDPPLFIIPEYIAKLFYAFLSASFFFFFLVHSSVWYHRRIFILISRFMSQEILKEDDQKVGYLPLVEFSVANPNPYLLNRPSRSFHGRHDGQTMQLEEYILYCSAVGSNVIETRIWQAIMASRLWTPCFEGPTEYIHIIMGLGGERIIYGASAPAEQSRGESGVLR